MQRFAHVVARRIAACLAVVCSAGALAQQPVSPTLLVDVDRTPSDELRHSRPHAVDVAGSTIWFRATTAATGTEIWRTDGTAAGTRPIDDLGSGDARAHGTARALPDGTLLLVATAPGFGTEMFAVAPGDTVPKLLVDVAPGAGSSFPVGPAVLGETGWFFAEDGTPGVELWRTDGTPAGTVLDEDVQGTPYCRMHAAAGRLWLIDNYWGAGVLRVKDGPGVPTRALLPVADLVATDFVGGVGDKLVFRGESPSSGTGRELWVSDGTAVGTRLLADVEPGPGTSFVTRLATAGGRMWLAALRASTGYELWVSDGTPAGTGLVVDLAPGRAHGLYADASLAAACGRGLVFYGTDTVSGLEPWFSDGTASGTRLLRDIAPGPQDAGMQSLVAHQGAVWFGAADPSRGLELWRTDGTSAGTFQVAELGAGAAGCDAKPVASNGDVLLFAGDDGRSGAEPWIVRAVAEPVHRLGNLAEEPVNRGAWFGSAHVHDDFAFLVVRANGLPERPWITDGTVPGTFPLDLGGAPTTSLWVVAGVARGVLFARGTALGYELWITDRATSGARRLAPFPDGLRVPTHAAGDGGAPILAGRAYFLARLPAAEELWSSDGTITGTRAVTTMAGVAGFEPAIVFAGRLFGRGTDPAHGTELWSSDLTAAGTGLVADGNPGSGSSFPPELLEFAGGLFFVATDPVAGSEPWISDGSAAGTRRLADVLPGAASSAPRDPVVVGERVLFGASRAGGGADLWATDGTGGGTVRLASFDAAGAATEIVAIETTGRRAFLLVDAEITGAVDLWVSDGTAVGTTRVVRSSTVDVWIPDSPHLHRLTAHGPVTFRAWSRAYGEELWVSDGTRSGTRPFADSRPGPAGSGATAAFRVGARALFVADDGRTGSELHAAPLGALGIPVADPIGRGCGATVVSEGAPRVGGAPFDVVFRASAAGVRAIGMVVGTAIVFGAPRPGCEVHVADPVDVGIATTDGLGRYRKAVVVPNDASLLGARLYLQAAIAIGDGPLFGGLEATEALELQVGR